MWIILLFLCASVIRPNNAQESTNFQMQTATETSYANSDVNSASTRSPVITLTIRDGRNQNIDRRVTPNSDRRLHYSEDWTRMFMPMNADRYANDNIHSVVHQLEPIFFRRSDSDENNTMPSKPAEINGFFDMQVPVLDFQGNLTSDSLSNDQTYSESQPTENIPTNVGNYQLFDLYRIPQNYIPPGVSDYNPPQSSLNRNTENLKSDETPKEISSSTEPKPSNFDLTTSRTSDEVIKPLPAEDRQREQVLQAPMDFYRDPRFFPQVPAYFPPYPFLPLQRDSEFQPMIPYLPNGQIFDRERGSEVNERIQEISEKQAISEDTTGKLVENLPSETSTSVIPEQALPFPAQRYPLQMYPFQYPIPNIPQPGFPFNPLPLPPPSNVQRDTIINDLPPLPPVPPVVPEVLPVTDTLIPEEQASVITGAEMKPEESVPIEEPTPTNIPYAFGFDMNDGKGNDQFRKEVSDIFGRVYGSYGFRDVDGRYRTVNYSAGKDGFHAFIQSNEPGIATSSSADVQVMAERPPPSLMAQGQKVTEPEIIVVPDIVTDPIASGIIPEVK